MVSFKIEGDRVFTSGTFFRADIERERERCPARELSSRVVDVTRKRRKSIIAAVISGGIGWRVEEDLILREDARLAVEIGHCVCNVRSWIENAGRAVKGRQLVVCGVSGEG